MFDLGCQIYFADSLKFISALNRCYYALEQSSHGADARQGTRAQASFVWITRLSVYFLRSMVPYWGSDRIDTPFNPVGIHYQPI